MVKAIKYTFRGMNRDFTESKTPLEFYYQANNIRFNTTDETVTGGFSFEKGNDLKVTIPTVTVASNVISYGTKTLNYSNNEITNMPSGSSSDNNIIGYAITRNSTILFTTDSAGFDCIWEVSNLDYDITLLYLNNLGFSDENPIQTIFNYENENIQKVYWIDGKSQVRAVNIKNDEIEGNDLLINIPSNTLNFVANVNFSQPTISEIGTGGNHVSGVIQYAYNLYRLNSSQTKISPFSELVSLDKGAGQGGGDVNEVVASIPIVKIENIDTSYTHIKIYAIKYTSYNQIPSVSLIDERELGGNSSITIFDDGTIISDLSIEELIFLGSNPIIPQHIETKDNIMFPINIKEEFFDVELDTRAYSYSSSPTAFVYNNVAPNNNGVPTGEVITIPGDFIIGPKIDAVNVDYNIYKFQSNGTTPGGEGPFLTYELEPKTATQLNGKVEDLKFLKDDEIYRIGIEFYNNLGQVSPAKWIADFKVPAGNLEGNYNTLKVTLKSTFDTWLATGSNFATDADRPIGYRIIRAVRNVIDRTIRDQGIVSPMLFQVKGEEAKNKAQFWATNGLINREKFQDTAVKIPSYLTRTFDQYPAVGYQGSQPANGVLQPISHLKWLSDTQASLGGPANNEGGEVYGHIDSNTLSQTFEYTKMMQFYSPEILFDVQTTMPAGMFKKVKGAQQNTGNGIYAKEIDITTKLENSGGKSDTAINHHQEPSSNWIADNNFIGMLSLNPDLSPPGLANPNGFIGPNGNRNSDAMDFYQYHRKYTTFYNNTNSLLYPIYGAPEIADRGAGSTLYNKDPRYEYSNSLQSFISDGNNEDSPITSINSYGTKCGVIVLDDDTIKETKDRTSIEDMFNGASASVTTNENSILITEIVRDEYYAYLGGIYGGNSYEDKLRTNYIGIGAYKELLSSSNEVEIESAGDTFIQEFKFLRIGKTDTEVYAINQQQISEVVSCVLETTVDLKNRNDISLSNWDSRFQPEDTEFHNYNQVYSQEPSLVKRNAFDFTFKRIKNYDTRIIATKTKIPNETVDSWTDTLENTSKDLDGKYGPIKSVSNFRDQIYTFQDNALALIGINPRVQTQGNDGISIELGTGSTLYDYQYISTKSGCINKWGNLTTDSGIYYVDGLSKTFNRFDGKQIMPLSEIKGMHKYFINNLDVDNLRLDNPLKSTGISFGYDQINHDIYLTYNNTWTVCFNELLDAFTGFYSYNSPIYIYNKEKLLTIDVSDSQSIYETHAGDYNMFYGSNEESKLIFLANPEPDHEVTFNNLEYKSEAYNTNKVEQRYTWEAIRAYNEFQDSGEKTPEIRKLNRKYRLTIPRNANTTDRIRNTWSYIELTADNVDKYLYQNHDIILYYTPNYILIR